MKRLLPRSVSEKTLTEKPRLLLLRSMTNLYLNQFARWREKRSRKWTPPSGKFPEGAKGDTRDKVAESLGVSGKTAELTHSGAARHDDRP